MAKNRKAITSLSSRYTKLPNEIFEIVGLLTKQERRTYWDAVGVYAYFINSAEHFHPGLRDLSTKLGKSKSSIEKSLQLLVSIGFMTKPPHRNSGRDFYTFIDPRHWSVWSRQQSVLNAKATDLKSDSVPSCELGHNYKEESITKGGTLSPQPREAQPWLSKAIAELPEAIPNPHVPCSTHIISSSADLMAELGIEG